MGFAYGAPATESREWWRDHLETAPERTATFHFSELMVREQWRKTGTAERLHRALMETRAESLAALLVDSPVFAVMLVDLPPRSGSHRQRSMSPYS
ncbi:hypothetical protein [Streptomyces sp. DSM 110735]|uniref:hypothetical protein n=1 Tax=Streptomyces sp. DSM 110735 TaxID=2775031 RepID=UPI0027DB0B71|nr:hypothetical protein [Streptomyces sp. DSM 110735]